MPQNFSIFEPAYQFIDTKLQSVLHDQTAAVIGQLAAPMRAALVLYVLLYGVAILRGAIREPIVDFAVRSLKLSAIYLLATTVAYSDWVTTPLFQTLPDAVTQMVSGSAATDPGAAFDQFFGRAAYLAEKVSQDATLNNLPPLVVAAAIYIIGAIAAALGFGVVVTAKVALALLVTIGPMFVGCALFDVTRRFFIGWLSQAVNYVVLMALIAAVYQLILSLVGDQWAQIDGPDPIVGGLLFIALALLASIFFLQTPSIAAGIAGGASTGIADFGNAASSAWRSVSEPHAKSSSRGGASKGTPEQ